MLKNSYFFFLMMLKTPRNLLLLTPSSTLPFFHKVPAWSLIVSNNENIIRYKLVISSSLQLYYYQSKFRNSIALFLYTIRYFFDLQITIINIICSVYWVDIISAALEPLWIPTPSTNKLYSIIAFTTILIALVNWIYHYSI